MFIHMYIKLTEPSQGQIGPDCDVICNSKSNSVEWGPIRRGPKPAWPSREASDRGQSKVTAKTRPRTILLHRPRLMASARSTILYTRYAPCMGDGVELQEAACKDNALGQVMIQAAQVLAMRPLLSRQWVCRLWTAADTCAVHGLRGCQRFGRDVSSGSWVYTSSACGTCFR